MIPTLALDLATKLGWALRQLDGELRFGTLRLKHQRKGRACARTRIRAAYEALPELLRPVAFGRGELVYERSTTIAKSAAPIRVAGHLEGVLLELSGSFLVPAEAIHTYSPAEIKKFATGKGNASKDAMVKAVRGWGHDVEDDNQADSVALLRLHESRREDTGPKA